MENTLETLKNDWLEWWHIFKITGNVEDARAFLQSLQAYDLLLNEEKVELEN